MLGIALAWVSAGCEPSSRQEFIGINSEKLISCADGPTVKGIDVSYFQGTVDWERVKSAGHEFAFARINDGTFMDPQFQNNWNGIKGAGLIRGAYQFFEPTMDIAWQAQVVVDAVGRLEAGDLPVTLDVEWPSWGGTPNLEDIRDWLKRVEQGTGKKPMIYTGAAYWDQYFGDQLADYLLWVPNYQVNCPNLPDGWSRWSFWQTSDTSSCPGIDGHVDTNVFNGSSEQLRALANGQNNQACEVKDGKLWCTNKPAALLRATTRNNGSIVDYLRTTYSWFLCWDTGDRHAGDNTTWYYTYGDDRGAAGWVAAVNLKTTSEFDANPSAKGLARCE